MLFYRMILRKRWIEYVSNENVYDKWKHNRHINLENGEFDLTGPSGGKKGRE